MCGEALCEGGSDLVFCDPIAGGLGGAVGLLGVEPGHREATEPEALDAPVVERRQRCGVGAGVEDDLAGGDPGFIGDREIRLAGVRGEHWGRQRWGGWRVDGAA